MTCAVAVAGIAAAVQVARSAQPPALGTSAASALSLEAVGFARIPVGRGVVRDGFLFATTGREFRPPGLHVVDVRNPAEPQEVAFLELPGPTESIARQGDHVFVTADDGGLRVIDISDPLMPRELPPVSTIVGAKRVLLHSGFAYVSTEASGGGARAEHHEVVIVDVRDPGSAVTASSLSAGDWATAGSAKTVRITWMERIDNTLLVWVTEDWSDHRLVVLDISAPAEAKVLAAGLRIPTGLCCTGDRYMYADDQVYDVKDPLSPVVAGASLFPGGVKSVGSFLATSQAVFGYSMIRRISLMRGHGLDGAGEVAHWDAPPDLGMDFMGISAVADDLVFVYGWGDTGMGLQILRVNGLTGGRGDPDKEQAPGSDAPADPASAVETPTGEAASASPTETPALPAGLPATGGG